MCCTDCGVCKISNKTKFLSISMHASSFLLLLLFLSSFPRDDLLFPFLKYKRHIKYTRYISHRASIVFIFQLVLDLSISLGAHQFVNTVKKKKKTTIEWNWQEREREIERESMCRGVCGKCTWNMCFYGSSLWIGRGYCRL